MVEVLLMFNVEIFSLFDYYHYDDDDPLSVSVIETVCANLSFDDDHANVNVNENDAYDHVMILIDYVFGIYLIRKKKEQCDQIQREINQTLIDVLVNEQISLISYEILISRMNDVVHDYHFHDRQQMENLFESMC